MKNVIQVLLIFMINTCCGQNHQNNLVSGRYGTISLVAIGDSINGVFQYYKDWNEGVKDFESKSNFYFYGKKVSKTKFNIFVTNPAEIENFGDVATGFINFENDTLVYFQNSLQGMYQPPIFFESNIEGEKGYKSLLIEKRGWKEIRFIKATKTHFYGSPNKKRENTYLVKNDLVWILDKRNGWCLVEYFKFDSNILLATGWIKESDMYDSDAKKWKQ